MPLAINIQPGSSVPKYQQIANAFSRGIERKLIRKEEQLPSINELSGLYNISRDTAEKAYRLLKKKGMIVSVRGKGYYAVSQAPVGSKRILLLFNKLSPYKQAIYSSFVKAIGRQSSVDLQVYYEDVRLFEQILEENATKFTDFVIIPSFRGEASILARQAVDRHLAGKQITFLERILPDLKEPYRAVVQNFEEDIYGALHKARKHLRRYHKIKLYFPFDTNLSRGIIRGFHKFCLDNNFDAEVIFKGFDEKPLERGTVYIIIRDEQLVTVVHKAKVNRLWAGKDIGILAYNDSPLKQVVLDGITVMSTRHMVMGERAAKMLLDNVWAIEENEFVLIERGSL
ncbi:GntR family transcriptional regulator [Neolewinella persica]|uniref:GntR family transcriptional regulator n=1 Tax=Neolewinella persica TaxID=70998 RepID=UPI0005C44D3E|nr:GntR family transcriptional regulator [Neolewinella persica]